MSPFKDKPFHLSDLLWDLWCITSVIGIWPRFIEPKLLFYTKKTARIRNLAKPLQGLKVVQFSDLHFQSGLSDHFLERLSKKILAAKPDLLFFSGDFLCYSELNEKDEKRLLRFLQGLHAKYGCYAVFGNHDYADYVSINDEGVYDLLTKEKSKSLIKRGFKRLFTHIPLAKCVSERAQAVKSHDGLLRLLEKTPFRVLDNDSRCIAVNGSHLNIVGLGEYTLGKTLPEKAFEGYDERFPGIILLHNPDGIPKLKGYPGDIVLSGHTHGGQVNLPWMWRKFTLMENEIFKSGNISYDNRYVYVNRGIGSTFTFRWFAPPEILELTLAAAPH